MTDESGGTLFLVVGLLVVLLGSAALAIDLGMLLDSRGEAQRTADAAALAGASAFGPPAVPLSQQRETAEARALEWVQNNPIRGEVAQEASVQVIMDSLKVRVSLQRQGIPTWFARIFGRETLDVSARAAAWAATSGRAGCLKPFIVVDAWHDLNGNQKYDSGEPYDPRVTGWGTSFRNNDGTGYINDVGRPVVLKAGANGGMVQGFYFTIRIDEGQGANDLEDNIASTECNQNLVDVGDEIRSEPGVMPNKVLWGARRLVDADPGARWENGRIVNSAFGTNGNGVGSPRVINLPVTDPSVIVSASTKWFPVTNFVAVFIEQVQTTGNPANQGISGRFMTLRGRPDNCHERNTCVPHLIYLRLVE